MNKKQAQEFVNEIELQLLSYVKKYDDIDRMDELEECLEEFDHVLMRIINLLEE